MQDATGDPDEATAPLRVAVCVSGSRPLAPGALNYLASSLPSTAHIHYYFYLLHAGYANVGEFVDAAPFTAYGAEPRFHITTDNEFRAVAAFAHSTYPGSNATDVITDFYAMRRCNAIKNAQEASLGFEYDLVVRQRPDHVVSEPFDMTRYTSIVKDFIVIPDATGNRGEFKDQIVFSSSRNMTIYASILELIPEYCGFECPLDSDMLVRFHVMRTRLEVLWRPAGEWGVMLPIRNDVVMATTPA